MNKIRIDKGLGDAKIMISVDSSKEIKLFNGTIQEAISIVDKIISCNGKEGIWKYDVDYIDEWINMVKTGK